MSTHANTVLGPVPAESLGVVAIQESLLSVVPGAEHAFDITIDRADVFERIAGKLDAFRRAGGGTVVDSTGMFHGRDLPLYEALSRSTGVHIVASTGMGPESLLGGYFLTPQTNPPTPWPAERFADLFAKEVDEGMVVPRLERRAAAGLVVTAADPGGMTPTEESLFRGAARAALATGVCMSIRWGGDPIHDLEIVLDEQLPAERIIVGGMDRRSAAGGRATFEIAAHGAFVLLDHVGLNDDADLLTDRERVELVVGLVDAGFADKILLSSSATGAAFGAPANDIPYTHVLSAFGPLLRSAGLGEDTVRRITADNPRDLLTTRTGVPAGTTRTGVPAGLERKA